MNASDVYKMYLATESYRHLTQEELEYAVNHPDWEPPVQFVHDWERYVPESMVANWTDFDLSTRMAIFIVTNVMAENENWD